jgi:hypothetical protein
MAVDWSVHQGAVFHVATFVTFPAFDGAGKSLSNGLQSEDENPFLEH